MTFTIIISAFFYFLGTLNSPYHQLAYYFSEPSLVVYKSESASSIQVLDASGESVEGPVYTTRLVIWNSGTETIPYNEVLEPLEVSNPAANRVLSKSITNTIEKRANFSLVSPQTASNSFILQWEEFDPGAAIEVQLVVEGMSDGIETETDELNIRGAISRGFDIEGQLVKGNLVQGERGGRIISLFFVAFVILMFCFIIYGAFDITREFWSDRPSSFLGRIGKAIILFMVFASTLMMFAVLGQIVDGSILMSLFRPSLYAPF